MSQLRQKMIRAMQLREFSPKTQEAYVMFLLAYGYFFLATWFFAVAIMITFMATFLIRVLNNHASYIRIRRREYAYV